MATSNERFWSEQQGAARFKHRVLKNHIAAFAGMVGSTSNQGRVVYLDGYAGPGAYDDGTPGSPALALEVAAALESIRQLAGHFIELKASQAKKLRQLVAAAGVPGWEVHQGSCEDHLNSVIAATRDDPLLVFLDPYGLAIPLELLQSSILSRPKRRGSVVTKKTEVVLNFSISAITRLAGFLDKDYRVPAGLLDEDTRTSLHRGRTRAQLEYQRDNIVEKLDAFLGGSWWHEIKRSEAVGWQVKILERWVQLATANQPGWSTVSIPVPDTWNGQPAFYLVLFTQSPYGIHQFNDAVSRAYGHMFDEAYEDADSSTRLFALEETKPLDLKEKITAQLVQHLRQAIANGLQGRILDNQLEIYGPVLGRAKTTHLRAALLELVGDLIDGPIPAANKLLNFELIPRR